MLMAQHTVFMAIFLLPPANIWRLAPSGLQVELSLPGRSMCRGRRLAMQQERQQLQGTSAPLIQKRLLADARGAQCLPEMDDTAMERMSSLNRARIPGLHCSASDRTGTLSCDLCPDPSLHLRVPPPCS